MNNSVNSSPKDWLAGFNQNFLPGLGLPAGNITFFKGQVAPFVIGMALFILIIVSLFFLLIGGIRWIVSGGDKEGMAKAKAMITYAIIGLVLGLSSILILGVIGNLLGGSFF